MARPRKRVTHTDNDLKFMDRIYKNCAQYIPNGIQPFDNLYLMQDLLKVRPDFELTKNPIVKQAYEYGFLCGFYSAIQFHNEKETERKNIKDFLKADAERIKKENESNKNYNWFTENKN